MFFNVICDEGGPDGAAVHFAFVDGGLETNGAGYGVLVDAQGVEVVVVDYLTGLFVSEYDGKGLWFGVGSYPPYNSSSSSSS